jgi:integrase
MIADGHCRSSINKNMGRVRRMFRWAIENELCPPSILTALEAVQGLQQGRTEAVEGEPVKPVPIAHVEAIEPHVSRPIWAMVQLQLFTGMRPGEVLIMRGCDLNMTGKVWEYVPQSHKTEHHGKQRIIFLGPKAQAVIRPFLKTDLQAYLFSPRDVRGEPIEGCQRQPGECYNRDAYRNAIKRGFAKAMMPREYRINKKLSADERKRRRRLQKEWMAENCWHPHQIRHTAATAIRREADIDTARTVLGHSSVRVTELYAERDGEKARNIMAQVG